MEKSLILADRLLQLQYEQQDVSEQLARAIVLEQLWPEAFEYGEASGRYEDNDTVFIITRGDGSERAFSREQLPEGLRI